MPAINTSPSRAEGANVPDLIGERPELRPMMTPTSNAWVRVKMPIAPTRASRSRTSVNPELAVQCTQAHVARLARTV